MFRGMHTLNLDIKGRMAIPSKFRETLRAQCDGNLIVTVDRDHCLLLYPLPEWEMIEAKLAGLPNLDMQTRRLQRLMIGHATECDMDGNHRILLSPSLREFATLEKKVVLIGQGNKLELWNEQSWLKSRSEWLEENKGEVPLSAELEALSL